MPITTPPTISPVFTYTIGASGSSGSQFCNFICVNTNDIVTAVANGCAAVRAAGGGRILIKAGTYNITTPVIIDADWITVEGEGNPNWNRFNAAWPTTSSEGTPGGTKIKAIGNTDGIHLGGSYMNGGDNRHKGVSIKNLYLYGFGNNGYAGIWDTSTADTCTIEGCLIHNFSKGIVVSWDTATIINNSIQSCYGDGITYQFVYGRIEANIIYDIGGTAIVLTGTSGKAGVKVIGNTIGSVGNGTNDSCGIISYSLGNVIVGNTITGIASFSGDGVRVAGTSTFPADFNVISSNLITKSNDVGNSVAANLRGCGVNLMGVARSCTVMGNTIVSNVASDIAPAIQIAGGNGGNSIVGNAIFGNWAFGDANKISDLSGATNTIANNTFQATMATPPTSGTIPQTMVAWWDASNAASITGPASAITNWASISPATISATGAAGIGPASGLLTQNGLNTLQFNGTSNVLKTAYSAAMSASAITLFWVGKSTVTTRTVIGAPDNAAGSSPYFRWVLYHGTGGNLSLRLNGTDHTTPLGAFGTRFNLVSYRTTDQLLRVDGNTYYNPGGSNTLTYPNNLGLCIGGDWWNNEYMNGNVCEIIVYPSALTNAQISYVEQYLRSKWGTT